ncbi:kinesin-like protein KIN-7C [Zingiber officinale]|uniref:kinesin-like protein KIN-7C n=1 Tax=Zingiber officinale TaxID=94328 RepID=UPI001C4BAD66|nr:kinesin-like protein KIN-7C [Zingiber officinale]XP_042386135.1 kinesin-like protein KIN-7C [Zingiber officinale]
MGSVSGEELARWEKMEATAGERGGEKVERIFVSVRLRPLSKKEVAMNDPCDWECINDTTIIFRNNLSERSISPTAYTFDRVFRSACTTKQVYEEGAKEVALSVVSGINATIFAYGQTSSGKTYTMTGITECTALDIYEYIHKHNERAFVLKFSAIEIYNEAVKDLLSTDSYPLRLLDDPEKGTVIEKLTEEILKDWNHLKALISVCEAQRKIGETSLNETSSRSHQILRLTIESCAQEFLGKHNSAMLVASVNFVDLAGSERASQALSVGTRLKEGCHINRSLLTLGSVIRKLSKGRNGHIPYRDSKLTRILQPSLGGNSRTAIICTMSPARSHIEQSRNTLFFASCAKEVATSAQVNIVMSDKALVKHLQKELARLESEMKYSGIAPSVETLLREKDLHIKKLECEIKKLIQQRDIAQFRMADLLQIIQKDPSKIWESSQTPAVNETYACDDLISASELSDNLSIDSASLKCVNSQNQYNQTGTHVTSSLRHTVKNLDFIESPKSQGDEEFEELCQDVHCIEVNGELVHQESESMLAEGSNSLQRINIRTPEHEDFNHKPEGQLDQGLTNDDPVTLEQHLQNVKKTLINLVKAYPDGSSPCSTWQEQSFRGVPLSRSKSCRSTLMSSSIWLQEANTPPDISLKEFPGRPQGLQKKWLALDVGDNTKNLSATVSQISIDTARFSSQKLNSEDASSVKADRLVVGHAQVNEMNEVYFRKDFNDQKTKRNEVQDFGAEDTGKVLNLAPSLDSLQCPSEWPREFEKHQREIIELWHECNVSLVHRTCFYMLFTGDPTDSIYMEVESRRLSFLKSTLSRKNIDKASTAGQSSTSPPSLRLLRRERDMLCRQMQKSLSTAERDSLYVKWGIALDSKQRRMQLAWRLWSEPKDLEHVRASASVVASLIGLLDQGHALKEMFGLTFSPQKSNRRFNSWRNGLSYLK